MKYPGQTETVRVPTPAPDGATRRASELVLRIERRVAQPADRRVRTPIDGGSPERLRAPGWAD